MVANYANCVRRMVQVVSRLRFVPFVSRKTSANFEPSVDENCGVVFDFTLGKGMVIALCLLLWTKLEQ